MITLTLQSTDRLVVTPKIAPISSMEKLTLQSMNKVRRKRVKEKKKEG